MHRTNARRSLLVLASLCVTAAIGLGPEPGNQEDPDTTKPATTSPSLQMVADNPKLPRVLLIGDSISMGYTLRTRKLLDGAANVHRPSTNCGSTAKAMTDLAKWLGTYNTGGEPARKWDVIHFNFGLHDLKYVNDRGTTVAAATGHQNVPPDVYEKNLRAIVRQLQATGATLVWASTTPTQAVMPGHLPADVIKYNAIAAKVMTENGIAIDDLYATVLPRLDELQLPANVHFKGAGCDVLAAQVKTAIAAALDSRKAK